MKYKLKKQYCKIQKSELKNETRLLKGNTLRLKYCKKGTSNTEIKQSCQLYGNGLKIKQDY